MMWQQRKWQLLRSACIVQSCTFRRSATARVAPKMLTYRLIRMPVVIAPIALPVTAGNRYAPARVVVARCVT